jgi:hypothetical protein
LLREEMAVKAGERGLGEQCIEMTYTTWASCQSKANSWPNTRWASRLHL